MANINPADKEAQKNLNISLEAANKSGNRAGGIALIVICLLLVFGFGIAIYVGDHPSFSNEENRTLTTDVDLSLSGVLDGSTTSSINSFYTDQFPLRNLFLKLKAVCELTLLKHENNNVIVGSDGYIVKKLEYSDYSYLNVSANTAKKFSEKLASENKNVTVAVTPRSIDVLRAYLPDAFSYDRTDAVWERLSGSGLEYTDLRDALRAYADGGEEVYFKTDHHWTALGAYVAYVELSDELGYTPLPLDSFTRVTVSDDFFGTTHSSASIPGISADKLELFRYASDEDYNVELVIGETTESLGGLYNTSRLETKDKYSVFLGGNYSHVRISMESESDREKLVIIKDSFANSLVPFLAIHFDLEIIDLRYFTGSTYQLIEENSIDNVLVLCNIDSMATSDSLKFLAYGLN